MFKKRIIALLTGLALTIAVVGASIQVAGSPAGGSAPEAQRIACNGSGSSGGC
jgi:hypothetical protein